MCSNYKMKSTAKGPPTPPPPPPFLSSHGVKGEIPPISSSSSLETTRPDSVEKAIAMPTSNEPTWYFFYGTLTKPEILKHILDLQEEPFLRSAKVIGYKLASWGQYKALIDGEPGEEVFGVAYKVETIEHQHKLARYETNAYKLHACQIIFTDGMTPTELSGNTFMYAGDAVALQAGRFDRVLWEMQMGMRLPDKWRAPMGRDS